MRPREGRNFDVSRGSRGIIHAIIGGAVHLKHQRIAGIDLAACGGFAGGAVFFLAWLMIRVFAAKCLGKNSRG